MLRSDEQEGRQTALDVGVVDLNRGRKKRKKKKRMHSPPGAEYDSEERGEFCSRLLQHYCIVARNAVAATA